MSGPDRREFLRASAAGLVALLPGLGRRPAQDTAARRAPVQGAAPAGELWDPNRVTAVQPVTAADNDAAIQAIEKQLKCTCGCGLDVYTCRTTDFTCPVSPKMHREVVQLAAAGMSGPAIVGQFVKENGLEILMAPPKRGFNLTGYYLPGTVMLAAAVLLFLTMRRWVRRSTQNPPATAGAAPGAASVDISQAELERLRDALQHTDA